MDEQSLPHETQLMLQGLRDAPPNSQTHYHGGYESLEVANVEHAPPDQGWDHAFRLTVTAPGSRKRHPFEIASATIAREVPAVVFQVNLGVVMSTSSPWDLVRHPTMELAPKSLWSLGTAWRIWVHPSNAPLVAADQHLLAAVAAVTPVQLRRKLPDQWSEWLGEATPEDKRVLTAGYRGSLTLFFAGARVYVIEQSTISGHRRDAACDMVNLFSRRTI